MRTILLLAFALASCIDGSRDGPIGDAETASENQLQAAANHSVRSTGGLGNTLSSWTFRGATGKLTARATPLSLSVQSASCEANMELYVTGSEMEGYWSPDDKEHYFCAFHNELRDLGYPGWFSKHGWIAMPGKYIGFECDDCREESGVVDGGLDAHIALARRYDAWVVVDESERSYQKIDHLVPDDAARHLRESWAEWMAPTQELAEARMRELISSGDGSRRYVVRRAIDVLLEDFEIELMTLARAARLC